MDVLTVLTLKAKYHPVLRNAAAATTTTSTTNNNVLADIGHTKQF